MPGVPAFILRRLYVKGSLANTATGWQFKLQNSLGSGYARQLFPLTLDDAEVPLESAGFNLDGKLTGFHEVDESNTFALPMNKEIVISVAGAQLGPGAHKIGMSFVVPGFGEIGFDFTDEVAVG